MTPTFSSGKLHLCFFSLLEDMTIDDKVEMLQAMACEQAIFEHVASQIITGWTENDSHAPVDCVAEPNPKWGLDKAWRDVAKMSGDVAKREIERLEKALLYSAERLAKANTEIASLNEEILRMKKSNR